MFQLASPVSAGIEIKKSRFIAWVGPAADRQAARQIVQDLRLQHPDAGHVCWALITSQDSGMDDDGEPAGTAAKPIYNVLTHKQLSNVLGAVVRYWGGVKLGAGGLTRAYGQAVSDALKLAEFVPVVTMVTLAGAVPFASEAGFRRLCQQFQVEVLTVDYAEQVQLTLRLPEDLYPDFEVAASNFLKGQWHGRPLV